MSIGRDLLVIPEAARSVAIRNPYSRKCQEGNAAQFLAASRIWIPGSPLRGAPE
jgi:hypothetical protein